MAWLEGLAGKNLLFLKRSNKHLCIQKYSSIKCEAFSQIIKAWLKLDHATGQRSHSRKIKTETAIVTP